MALYEHVLLARQDITSQQVDELVEHFKGVVSENGGTVAKVESWGLKSLQFRINKNRKAHYVLLNIDAPGPAIHELERQERIHEDVLRYLTVRVDELEEGQSAMMRRDERRERTDRFERGGERFGGDRDRGDRGGDRGPRGDRPDRGPRRDNDGGDL